jgi:hypothetical protein
MTSATNRNMGKALQNIVNFRTLFRPSGADGSGVQSTLTQKILGWIVFFILITVIALVLYLLISIIFKGYSRTLRDLVQWNFSNKVDVKSEFAGREGSLHRALEYLANRPTSEMETMRKLGLSFDVVGACEGDSCEDVFKNFFSVLDTYYEPMFRENKLSQALIDYIAYHDKISSDLSLKALTSEQRIHRVNFILDGIFNYMDKYAEIIKHETDVICKLNGVKGEKERSAFEKERKNMQKKLAEYLKTYGIQKVNTDKEFAEFFLDPRYIAKCGQAFSDIYNNLLKSTNHEQLRMDVQGLVKGIQDLTAQIRNATSDNQRETLKKSIQTKQEEKLKKEIEMARIRKNVTARTKQIKEQEKDDNTPIPQRKESRVKRDLKKIDNFFKKGIKKGQKNVRKKISEGADDAGKGIRNVGEQTATNINNPGKLSNNAGRVASQAGVAPLNNVKLIKFDGDDNEPLTSIQGDGRDSVIYVPCYEAYLHYVNTNSQEPTISSLLTKEMGKSEIAGYLFMKDLSLLENDTEDKSPPFIIRILKMYCAMENIASCVKKTVESPEQVRHAVMNILLDNSGENARLMKLDVMRNKGALIGAYESENFKTLKVETGYTWYIAELIFMATTNRENVFDDLLQRFNALLADATQALSYSGMVQYAQRLNTYLNIVGFNKNNQYTSSSQSKVTNNISRVITGLNIDKRVQEFIEHYPLFSTIYLSATASLDVNNVNANDYQQVRENANNAYKKTKKVFSSLLKSVGLENIELDDNFVTAYDTLVSRVHTMKQFILYAHITHIYFTQYRHIIIEKDKTSKTRYEREGFVELYNEQNMSSEEFFYRLITPFKKDFIDNRVFSAWKKTFYGPRFSRTSKLSYWVEFEAFWIGTLRPKADKMIKDVWGNVGKSAKLRW